MSGNPAYRDGSPSAARFATVMLSPRRWFWRVVAAFSATAALALAIWLVLLARELFPAKAHVGAGGAAHWNWPGDLTRAWRDVTALAPAVLIVFILYFMSLLRALLAAVHQMEAHLRRMTQEPDDLPRAPGPDTQKEARA